MSVNTARPRRQTYTMDMYLRKIRNGRIRNDADAQRDFSWKNEHFNELIVTVLNDDYIPPVILGEEESTQLHIMDGGCRSTALIQFRYGNHKITSCVEDPLIPYKRRTKDQDGKAALEDAVFDIRNKTYDKLPTELKEKFDEYQIETVIHENCDRQRISKYIKRYNNHVSMNVNQKAFTYLYNFAGYVREMAESRFFTENSRFTEKERSKGMIERVIVETVMCTYHLDKWKKQTKGVCKYLNDNASYEEFEKLEEDLHRLEIIVKDDVRDIFNSKDSFIFLTLFDRFTELGAEDIRFYEFLREFKATLRKSEKGRDGQLFDEIDKDKGTKDRSVITAKLALLEMLMSKFLHEHKSVNKSGGIEMFISENLGIDVRDFMKDEDFYNDSLDDLLYVTVKDGSKLLDRKNRPSMLAMMVYSYEKDRDLEDWLTQYASKNNAYFVDQKKNFQYMLRDFKEYDSRGKGREVV